MEHLLEYLTSFCRLCRLVGTSASEHLEGLCLDSLTQEQLVAGANLYNYHCRRILSENGRKETEQMLFVTANLEATRSHLKRARSDT
jgi:hypothetical protein